jgi:hypothetical protein
MNGRLSRGSVDLPVGGLAVAAWWRARLPGRHGLKCRLDRPVWSGSYARAGYLKTLIRRRACILETGATWLSLKGGLPTTPTRVPVDGDVAAFWLLVAPRQPPGAFLCLLTSVQGGGLPAESGELARDRDRDRPRGLAALSREVHPALVQALLAAPGDLHDTGILA